MSVAAEPASGSEIATATVASPLTTLGRICFLCSSVPKNSITRFGPVLASNTWNAAGRHSFRQLLDHDQCIDQRTAQPAVLLVVDDAEEAELGEAAHLVAGQQRAVEVPLRGLRRIHLTRDLRRQLAQLPRLGGEGEAGHGGVSIRSRGAPTARPASGNNL